MIDVKKIVENIEEVRRALLKRMKEEDMNLDEIVKLHDTVRTLQSEYDTKKSEQNSYNEKMSQLEKGSPDFVKLIEVLKEKASEVKDIENNLKEAQKQLNHLVEVLPNIPDEDVVAGGKENNQVMESRGEKPEFNFTVKDHLELGENLGIFDFETAAKISGNNFVMYRGKGAQLEWALLNYFVSQHVKDGYEMILPPHIVNSQSAYTTGQLPKFRGDVYWVNEDQCLIPTSETSLTNIYRDQVLSEADLPKKFFSYTPCYRKEAGSYRANERGMIRVHQFNKVEMYQFTTKDKSDEALEELLFKAENLVESLGLHFQRVKLAADDCSQGASKTYDVEVWIPSMNQYYEVSSVSNTKDYQSRRGNMRYKPLDGSKPEYMHTLNASGLATSRLMVAIVETYQQEDGSIVIPEVLRPFTGFDKIEA